MKASSSRTLDMTTGSPLRLLLAFALPIFLGNLLQQFYNLADTALAGHILGDAALAQIGATAALYSLLTSLAIGITNGFALLISHAFGCQDETRLRQASCQMVLWTGILAALLTVGFLLAVRPLLVLLKTPADTMEGALSYIIVILAGIPLILAYNLESSMLRAVGNSLDVYKRQSLESWVLMLLEGKLPLTKETMQKRIQDSLYGAWSQQKKTAGYVFGLAVSSCAFSGFVGILAKSQAAKMAVSMLYFLMITVLVQVTAGFSGTAEETVGKMVSFLQILMPTYLAVSVMAKGSLGSAAFYELMLGALGMLQSLLRYVVIPLADLYLLTALLGNLSEKNRFSRMSELLKQAVDWSLKTIIVFVAGLQTVQNLSLIHIWFRHR